MSWLYHLVPWRSDYYADAMHALFPNSGVADLFGTQPKLFQELHQLQWLDDDGFSRLPEHLAERATVAALEEHRDYLGRSLGGIVATQLGLADKNGRLHIHVPVPMMLKQCLRRVDSFVTHVASVARQYAPALFFVAAVGVFVYAASKRRHTPPVSGQQDPLMVTEQGASSSNKLESREGVESEVASIDCVLTVKEAQRDMVPAILEEETALVLHIPTVDLARHRNMPNIWLPIRTILAYSLWDAVIWLRAVLMRIKWHFQKSHQALHPARAAVIEATATHGSFWHAAVDAQYEIMNVKNDILAAGQLRA